MANKSKNLTLRKEITSKIIKGAKELFQKDLWVGQK